jgi:hypothetical protein
MNHESYNLYATIEIIFFDFNNFSKSYLTYIVRNNIYPTNI